MSRCSDTPYNLPTLSFVGGSTQQFAFHTYFEENGRPLSLKGCICKFSVIESMNRTGIPVFTKNMNIVVDPDNETDNILTVELLPAETMNLFGKYVYQITIKGPEGDVDIPGQGLLYVNGNIDKALIS